MNRPTNKQFDTREILWKARRYRWMALVPVVAMCCGAFLYLRMTTPIYESSVLVSLGDRTQVSAALEPMVRSEGARGEGISEKLARIRNRVMNRTFLQDLAQRTGYTDDPRLKAYAAREARKHTEVTAEEFALRHAVWVLGRKFRVEPSGLNNIKIAVHDPSPRRAQQLAAALADGLIEDTRRTTLGRIEARGAFSQDQIAVYTEKVRQDENALRAFQESMISRQTVTGVVNPENVEIVRELADAANKELEQVRGRIQQDRATWAQQRPGAPLPDLQSPTASELTARLGGLEASYGAAALRRREGTPESQTLLAQIATVRQDLLMEYEAAASVRMGSSYSRAEAQLAAGIALDRAILRSIQQRKDRLSSLLGTYVNQARGTPREQMELERLRSNLAMSRDNLAALQKEATASNLSEALETSQMSLRIDILEPPVLPLFPVWPDRLKVLLGAIGAGIFLAVVLIVAMERVGAIVRTVEQAESELGVKVIGTIPRIEGWSRPGSFFQNHWAPLSIVALVLVTALVTGIHSTLSTGEPRTPRTGQASH
ncbi:MAG TPA: hypothetical protein VLT84_07220 [Acidobacteriota bacterium]|nr:hypothetical protein [Acidobacteriota bacterium]